MRFDAKTGKYVDAPQPTLGPAEKGVTKVLGQVQATGGEAFAVAAVADIAAIGVDAGIKGVDSLAHKIAGIFKKKG